MIYFILLFNNINSDDNITFNINIVYFLYLFDYFKSKNLEKIYNILKLIKFIKS